MYSTKNELCILLLAIIKQDWRKDTALIGACQSGQAATARVLLEHGAIADYQNTVRNLYVMITGVLISCILICDRMEKQHYGMQVVAVTLKQ